jgi:DNA-directed RNA polymerase specialized sigma subunit
VITLEQKQQRQQKNEEKKNYLQGYRKCKQKVKRLEEQIAELCLSEMTPSLVVSDMPSAHNKRDLSDYIVKYDKLYAQLIKAKEDAVDCMAEIQQRIETVPDENEKTVLTLRYLKSYSWEKICVEMAYSWRQVHYIHSSALEHFKIIA